MTTKLTPSLDGDPELNEAAICIDYGVEPGSNGISETIITIARRSACFVLTDP